MDPPFAEIRATRRTVSLRLEVQGNAMITENVATSRGH